MAAPKLTPQQPLAFLPDNGMGIGFPSLGSPYATNSNTTYGTYATNPLPMTFLQECPPSKLAQFAAAGINYFRINWHPGPAMEAIRNNDSARFAVVMGPVDDAINLLLGLGFGVMLCCHLTNYNNVDVTTSVINSGPNGAQWLNYVATISAVASRYAYTDPRYFVLESFNEPSTSASSSTTGWYVLDPILGAAIRAAMPNHTYTMTTDTYSDPNVDYSNNSTPRVNYINIPNDPNVMIILHGYVDYRTTEQGFNYGGFLAYCGGIIPYPPTSDLRATTLTAFNARTTAASVDSGTVSYGQQQIGYYFDFFSKPSAQIAVGINGLIARGITANRINFNEYGITRTSPRYNGADYQDPAYPTLAAAAVNNRFLQLRDITLALDKAGVRRGVFSADAQDYSLTDKVDNTLGILDPRLMGAWRSRNKLKLSPGVNRPWTPADLNSLANPNRCSWFTADKWYDATGWGDGASGVRAVLSGTAMSVVTINGYNYISFTGAGQFNAPFVFNDDSIACFMTATNANTNGYVRALTLGADNLSDYSSSPLAVLLNNGSGSVVRSERSGNNTTAGANTWPNTPTMVSAVFDGTQNTVWENGVLIATGTGTSFQGPFAAMRLCIGGSDQGNGGWIGGMRDIIVLRGKFTVAERQKIEGFIMWNAGLQSSLPSGHPNISAPPIFTY